MSKLTLDAPPIKRLAGLVMVILFTGMVALVWAMFTGVFKTTVTVTVQSNRAGLMMAADNRVKYHGVQVGTVSAVRNVGDGAEMVLDLEPAGASRIPADATAQISPETLFGNKYIEIVDTATATEESLHDGAVVVADRVGTEVNTAFQNLMNVLEVANPSQVSATLHAISSALQGRGNQVGQLLADTSTYLGEFNDTLPDLRRDLQALADVSHLYADVAPELFKTLDNATEIGGTLADKQKALHAFLEELERLGATGTELFSENGRNLIKTLRLLEPTSTLLDEYSPMLSCFIKGTDNARRLLEPALGGKRQSGVLMLNILPGKEPYSYPEDLPEVDADSGPDCHGLPNLAKTKVPAPQIVIPGNGYVPENGPGSDSVQPGDPPLEVLLDPATRGRGPK